MILFKIYTFHYLPIKQIYYILYFLLQLYYLDDGLNLDTSGHVAGSYGASPGGTVPGSYGASPQPNLIWDPNGGGVEVKLHLIYLSQYKVFNNV